MWAERDSTIATASPTWPWPGLEESIVGKEAVRKSRRKTSSHPRYLPHLITVPWCCIRAPRVTRAALEITAIGPKSPTEWTSVPVNMTNVWLIISRVRSVQSDVQMADKSARAITRHNSIPSSPVLIPVHIAQPMMGLMHGLIGSSGYCTWG